MVATADSLIGRGLYTPSEAALYARLPSATMRRWLYGNTMGQAALRPECGPGGEKVVTFLDFVQALAVREIRTQHKIALNKIRDAVDRAEDQYGVTHPFARRHTTYLLGREILVQVDVESIDSLTQVSGKRANQTVMRPIVELYLKDLAFGADGLAELYQAYAWRDRMVVMDPRHRFGEPIVADSGYTAQSLWQASITEGGFEAAAEAYGVEPEDVEVAYRYYDHLQGKPAA